jgi:Protein of unknown function (DUF3037)
VHTPVPSESLSFEYATIRLVPRVEREEFINAGVIVFCMAQKMLLSKILVEETKVNTLWPEIDLRAVRQHLEAIPRICSGDPDAGPIALLPARERFHWLVSPRSTVIQVSPVHSGLCVSPQEALNKIFERFVR